MAYPDASLKSGIPCQCQRWRHQAARGFAPLGTTARIEIYRTDESFCPKCRAYYLLLWHLTCEGVSLSVRFVGLAPVRRGEAGMREALTEIRTRTDESNLTGDAIAQLVFSAQASAAHLQPAA